MLMMVLVKGYMLVGCTERSGHAFMYLSFPSLSLSFVCLLSADEGLFNALTDCVRRLIFSSSVCFVRANVDGDDATVVVNGIAQIGPNTKIR